MVLLPFIAFNAILLSIGCLGFYFYLHFGLLHILGSWITAILLIFFGFFFVYLYTWLHVFAMNELKNNFDNPTDSLSFIHWNQKKLNLVGPTLQMMMSWGFSVVLFLCLVVPYFFSAAYYFFTPMILAFYPNASPETYRGHVAETMIQSKNIRLYLAIFPLLFFFAPMALLEFLSNLGFNNWIFITLGVIVFLIYPIYRYTVGTIYFYFQWETNN